MKVYLSNQGNLRNFQAFVRSLDFSQPDRLEITTHPRWVTVHPVNVALAAALALKVGRENAQIIGEVPESGRCLDQLGLYNLVATPSPFRYDPPEPAGRYVPIALIRNANDQSRLIADITPLLHLDEHNATIIRYVLGELVRNVLEHAYSDGAVVVAQYYKKTNRISIGICDTGVGIWRSMNQIWHPRTDADALRLALTPGITGTTRREGGTAENAGAGLFYIKSIAKVTRNYFVIYSGGAAYTLLRHRARLKGLPHLYPDPWDDPHHLTEVAPRFNGTLVGVDISLDNTMEFQTLLDLIGEAYEKAIHERRRRKYKEPKFDAGDSTEREIAMLPLVGSFAENKEVARRLRIEQIMPALSRGELVVLDFDGVTGTTQSFVHALISDALREQPEVAFDNLYFKNASPDVRKIVEIVYRYMQESLDGGF